MKQCLRCGKDFPTKGPKKYCLQCSKIINKEQQEIWRAKHKEKWKSTNTIESLEKYTQGE